MTGGRGPADGRRDAAAVASLTLPCLNVFRLRDGRIAEGA
jgi:hypothetical protein